VGIDDDELNATDKFPLKPVPALQKTTPRSTQIDVDDVQPPAIMIQ
jgi:hypothetical protein